MSATHLRRVCEHEAAHALVAVHYGLRVAEIRVSRSGAGHTHVDGAPTTAQAAAITAAGDLWEKEFSASTYIDAACSDLAALERTVGAGGVWQARRTARRILQTRRRDVLALAARLEREH